MKSKKYIFVPAACALMLALALLILLSDQVRIWASKEDYYFGFLVPFFVGLALYERWPMILAIFKGGVPEKTKDAFSPPAFWFLKPGVPTPLWLSAIFAAGTVFSLFLFATGAVGSAMYGTDAFTTYQNTLGFCGLCLGLAWFASGTNFAGTTIDARSRVRLLLLLVFPIFVWMISGPFTFLVDHNIKGILLKNVTAAVVGSLNLFGFDLVQEMNTIILPDGDRVGIEDACSGVRSLTACLFTGSFLAGIFVHTVKRKFFFIGVSILFALVLNVMRSGMLTIYSSFYGSAAIELDFWGNQPGSAEFTLGTVHDVVGWSAMIITFLLMIALVPIVNATKKRDTLVIVDGE